MGSMEGFTWGLALMGQSCFGSDLLLTGAWHGCCMRVRRVQLPSQRPCSLFPCLMASSVSLTRISCAYIKGCFQGSIAPLLKHVAFRSEFAHVAARASNRQLQVGAVAGFARTWKPELGAEDFQQTVLNLMQMLADSVP